jgi:hypothetical protein
MKSPRARNVSTTFFPHSVDGLVGPSIPWSSSSRTKSVLELLFRASGPVCFQVNYVKGEFSLVCFRWCSLESVSIFPGIRASLDEVTLSSAAQLVAPICRAFCTVKRRRPNDLGEMKACLQSRCSPSMSYTPTVGVAFILKPSRRFQDPFLRFSVIWSEPCIVAFHSSA